MVSGGVVGMDKEGKEKKGGMMGWEDKLFLGEAWR